MRKGLLGISRRRERMGKYNSEDAPQGIKSFAARNTGTAKTGRANGITEKAETTRLIEHEGVEGMRNG